jgi:hypothetical protein
MHTVPLLTLWVNVERTFEKKPLVNFLIYIRSLYTLAHD